MAPSASGIHLEPLSATRFTTAEPDLVHLLRACVDDGASLGYLAPMPEEEAVDFWRSLAMEVEAGRRAVFVAREGTDGRIVGSGQLRFESKPNGRHRAEVCKLLVLPSHRRRGIAARLMDAIEHLARERAIRMLFLDTSVGRGGATEFYETLGYSYAGGIPDWAVDPDGTPAKNAIYFKQLSLPPG